MGNVRFLREFLSQPGVIGAVLPSSPTLAKAMIAKLNLPAARAVLEYGPGTGVITEHIIPALSPTATFVAIEINATLAEIFRARNPSVTLVEDTVANVREICDRLGIESVDRIVASLPWAAFSDETQRLLLDATMRVLAPGACFVTFAYVHSLPLPAGRRFASLLPEYFAKVKRSKIVWRNRPTAVVYRCER